MKWILDQLLPFYDVRTHYSRSVAATPAAVWEALHGLTAEELPVSRLLMAARTGGRRRPSGPVIGNTPIPVLAQLDGREVVIGKVARFWSPVPVEAPITLGDPAAFTTFRDPGWAKAAMSFQITPGDGVTLISVETRVSTTDAASRRIFRLYWLLIQIGGAGLIRLEMMRAIAKRAESLMGTEP